MFCSTLTTNVISRFLILNLLCWSYYGMGVEENIYKDNKSSGFLLSCQVCICNKTFISNGKETFLWVR